MPIPPTGAGTVKDLALSSKKKKKPTVAQPIGSTKAQETGMSCLLWPEGSWGRFMPCSIKQWTGSTPALHRYHISHSVNTWRPLCTFTWTVSHSVSWFGWSWVFVQCAHCKVWTGQAQHPSHCAQIHSGLGHQEQVGECTDWANRSGNGYLLPLHSGAHRSGSFPSQSPQTP